MTNPQLAGRNAQRDTPTTGRAAFVAVLLLASIAGRLGSWRHRCSSDPILCVQPTSDASCVGGSRDRGALVGATDSARLDSAPRDEGSNRRKRQPVQLPHNHGEEVEMRRVCDGECIPPGSFCGGDSVPPGTFHGGDSVPPGTFH